MLFCLLRASGRRRPKFCRSLFQMDQAVAKPRIVTVPLNGDNYAYLLIDSQTNEAAIVDAGEKDGAKLVNKAKEEGVKLTTILATHHHWDHTDGNLDVVSKVGPLAVIGGDDRVPGLTQKVSNKDTVKVGSLNITCFFTPCHTKGHVLYYVDGNLFTGDTQFVGGCGKFTEGTGDQMNYALNEVIAKLPAETVLWCGHEYTVSNLRFALSVDPDNQALKDKMEWAQKQIAANLYTIPSTVAEELTYNPFFRVNTETIKKSVGDAKDSDADTMTKLREAKNNFRAQTL